MNRWCWSGLTLMLFAGMLRAEVGAMGAGALVAETAVTQKQLVAARLPAEAFAVADDTWSNVWVEERGGGRVPAVIERITGELALMEYPVYQRAGALENGWQTIDFATRGVPLSRLIFFTDGTLFGRDYTLHGLTPDSAGAVIERPVAAGALTQIYSQNAAATHLIVSFAPERYEVYRLRLAVGADSMSKIGAVRAEGPAWHVVVPLLPGHHYRLRVGGDVPDRPDAAEYDALTVLRALGGEPMPGRIEHFELITETQPPTFGRAHILLVAMLVAGCVLLWSLLRVAKRMR